VDCCSNRQVPSPSSDTGRPAGTLPHGLYHVCWSNASGRPDFRCIGGLEVARGVLGDGDVGGHPAAQDGGSHHLPRRGGVLFDKDKSTERIDGIVATIMAIGRALVAQEEPQPEYSMFFV
jgi:hypothetical protein